MLISLFLKGWLVGFSIAVPLGPIGLLCLKHSLVRGLLCGLVAGLGVALADAVYGALAGYGVGMFAQLITTYHGWLQLFGSLFLLYLSFTVLRSNPKLETEKSTQEGLLRIFITMFTITLTNPMTLLCIAGAFVGLGVCTANEGTMASVMVSSGVLIGSAAWWVILSGAFALIGTKVSENSVYWINKICGIAILCFSLFAFAYAIQQLYS